MEKMKERMYIITAAFERIYNTSIGLFDKSDRQIASLTKEHHDEEYPNFES